jgi:signal recognition particle receptor subunit beta
MPSPKTTPAFEELYTQLEEKVALLEQGYSLDNLPFVVQYNKRDMPGIVPIEELRTELNPQNAPDFEAIAPQGVGVFDTLKAVAKLVLQELRKAGG